MTDPETPTWKNDPAVVWPFGRPAEAEDAPPPEADAPAVAEAPPADPYVSRTDVPA
jgi:hypothetical protein